LRAAHGISASIILLFVAFHLTNHLSGLIGPNLHAAIMKAGRTLYRFPPVEVLLVGLLLFQIGSGLTLAVRSSWKTTNGFRVLQIGSGIYLASFVLTHLNSALVSARTVRHIETNWAWASGGTEGLLYDSWNIRLVPHYAYGVLFVLSHLLLGLRQVLAAHGVKAPLVNRLWSIGITACVMVTIAIMAGLLGLRL
jgi:succinate dehydrogenase/fumarate reductase cytochrome b subunit